jgi:hypothetical protein
MLILKELVEHHYLILKHQPHIICLKKLMVLFFKFLPDWRKEQ